MGTTSGEAQGLVLSWGGHLQGQKSEWEILGHEKLFLLLESDCQQGKKINPNRRHAWGPKRKDLTLSGAVRPQDKATLACQGGAGSRNQ